MEYTEEQLKKWVKENKNEIIEKLCKNCKPTKTKSAIFMAGSPGAGKTEIAKRLIENIRDVPFAHIDQDRIKSLLPGYMGELAEKYHGAASIGVDIVLSHILKQGYSFILDSTFSKFEKAKENIKRSLKKDFNVEIFFVYQEPKNAWDFVQKRKIVEGRIVPLESFVRQFIHSRITVNEIKKQFDNEVKLHLVLKTVKETSSSTKEKYEFNVENIDGYIEKVYTSEKQIYDLVSVSKKEQAK